MTPEQELSRLIFYLKVRLYGVLSGVADQYTSVKYLFSDLQLVLKGIDNMKKQINAQNAKQSTYIDKSFVPDIPLSGDAESKIIGYADDAIELMDCLTSLVEQDYKLTVNRTKDGASFCASLTHLDPKHIHGTQILSGFAGDARTALACVWYKYHDALGDGEWPTKVAGRGIH